jgi:ribose-phosphate pyrophosphokinase
MRLWTAESWFESTAGNLLPQTEPAMDGQSAPKNGFKLLSGTANRLLAEEIAQHLDVELCRVTLSRFADGELFVRIDENVRGMDVFIVQPTSPPAENILELLLMIDAARRASAARITCVIPYYGYSRQDRKDQPRVAIGAKLMANMIMRAGADRVLGVDFHQHQLQGFFDIPVDHLYAMPVFTAYFRKKQLQEPVVVAPDVGAAKMARGFAKRLNASLAIIDKRRPAANVSEVLNVVGEVEGRDCILADDMIDTAGTVSEAAHVLRRMGAGEIYICATHALLSGPAVDRLTAAPVCEVAVTDTLAIPDERRFSRLTILSVGELLSKAIRFTHFEQSVSSLFD